LEQKLSKIQILSRLNNPKFIGPVVVVVAKFVRQSHNERKMGWEKQNQPRERERGRERGGEENQFDKERHRNKGLERGGRERIS